MWRRDGADATAKKEIATDALNNDPDRPLLHRGKPAGGQKSADGEAMTKLSGLPTDLHQMIAVSDAKNRAEHDFVRPWEGRRGAQGSCDGDAGVGPGEVGCRAGLCSYRRAGDACDAKAGSSSDDAGCPAAGCAGGCGGEAEGGGCGEGRGAGAARRGSAGLPVELWRCADVCVHGAHGGNGRHAAVRDDRRAAGCLRESCRRRLQA